MRLKPTVFNSPKEILFAGLHILMRAIPDGPVDAGRRLHRFWYRESRCQVRTARQKTLCLCAFLCLYLLILAYFSSRSVKISVNPWLIKDLHACKVLYSRREPTTDVMSALQIRLFMQNKANFQKVKLNIIDYITKDYEDMDTWWNGKKQSQTNPNKANSNPISAHKMPKRTQFKAKQTQISRSIDLSDFFFAGYLISWTIQNGRME